MDAPVSYTTKSFILPLAIALIIIVQVSMGLMFIPILLELHFLFVMAALFGGILFCIGMLSGETVYAIDKEGISVKTRPMLPWKLWRYEKKRFYPWSSVSSYSIEEDMARSFEKFHFIKVGINGLTNDLKISDNAKYFAGFEAFKNAFIEMVETRNAQISEAAIKENMEALKPNTVSSACSAIVLSKEKPIKRKRSFYERPIAKIITLLFIAFIAGIGAFYISNPHFLKGEHVFRIALVIIPGIGYMFYRSFMEKK